MSMFLVSSIYFEILIRTSKLLVKSLEYLQVLQADWILFL